ncbi:MAG: ABC transporter permease [Candidatus Doudnabacteria bacterium]|nr:ABC transporter permease [Candidatus Doudnabacteria bacterium]
MRTSDLLEETLSAVTANKTRSGLTMLGIVIGIASVIALVAIGAGAQNSIAANIQALGANLLTISPGAQRTFGSTVSSGQGSAQSLTAGDADAIAKNISGIKYVSPETSGRYQIVAKGNNTNTSVLGVKPVYLPVHNLSVESGSFFADSQVTNYAKVAVIGPTVRDDLFGENAENVVGQTITIKGVPFTVIGITLTKGGTGFNNPDNNIYIPLTTAQRYFIGNENLGTISVQAENAEVMTQVQTDATALLMQRHKIAEGGTADFRILNQSDIVSTASSVTGVLTQLLAAVAGISLVVGGIGIMNMMLTTVTERTREIGLRKAIGARSKNINAQFLAEAVLLTFFGGAIGVFLGWLISFIVSYFNIVAASVSLNSILLAFSVSAGVGIIFGYYPARKAARMSPIEALRYE